MYIFLDESGDLGFSLEKSSCTRYFVIALLTCNKASTVKLIEQAVRKTLTNKINRKNVKNPKNEIKSAATLLTVKQYFYRQIESNNGWRIRCVILDKAKLLKDQHAITEMHRLYNFIARLSLENINIPPNIVTVSLLLDKCKQSKEIKIFNNHLLQYLEGHISLNAKLFIDHLPSYKHYGLQAVDLFAGGIFRKYERSDSSWYNIYKDRIEFEKVM